MNDKAALYKSKAPGAVPKLKALSEEMNHGGGNHGDDNVAHQSLSSLLKHPAVPTQGDKWNTKKGKLGPKMGQ